MIRPSTAAWLGIVACVGFVMFKVKYEVQDLEDQVGKVNREIAADRDAIHVLKAEWSFLSQPNRLADLAKRYLALAPISTAQLATLDRLDSIPMRPAALPALATPEPMPPSPAKPVPAGAKPTPAPTVAKITPAPPASTAKPAPAGLAGSSTAVAQDKTRILR